MRIELWATTAASSSACTTTATGSIRLATGYGTGLQGIADRLSVLEGSLVVTSVPGEGTTIAGSLPVGPADDRVATAEPGSDRLVTPAAT